MRIVGDHLADVAAQSADPDAFDLFSRSAFNRYYYSAFLSIRTLLKTLDPAWATPSHQSIPEVLKGEVLQRLKRHIRTAERSNQLTNTKAKQIVSTASTAVSELSNLLASARETRRLADYEPETKVARSDSAATLGAWTLEAARNWDRRVKAQSSTIRRLYVELGII